jgi:hypothetical protein
VVRRHVVAALAVGVAADDEDAARNALDQVDWIVRGMARRRLGRALIEAMLEVGDAAMRGDPAIASHVLRVALLRQRGIRDIDARDVGAVSRALAELPPPPPPTRRPTVTVLAVFASQVVIAAVVAGILIAPAPPARGFSRPAPPPSVGAFRDGGTPSSDTEIEAVLRVQLGDLVIATDQAIEPGTGDPTRESARAALHERVREAPAMARHGHGLAAAWAALIDALDKWSRLTPAHGGWDRAVAELRGRARVVSDQLAGVGLGYYLDADVLLGDGRRHAMIWAYRVDRVGFVTAGARTQRVLDLRRLDHVGVTRLLLGMHSEELGDPVVLLDQIDEHVTTHLLGAIGGASYPLGDAQWRQSKHGAAMADAAGAAVRRELVAALSDDALPAQHIGIMIASRVVSLDQWRLHVARGNEVTPELAQLGAARIAKRLQGIVAATVRRHEAQHAIDDARETQLRMPRSLVALVGPLHDADGEPDLYAHRAHTELSAYISQIASDPVTPQLALWALGRSAFDRGRWNRPEAQVATIVIVGLARNLGIAPTGPVMSAPAVIDRVRLAELGIRLADRSAEDLNRAAAMLWDEMFDQPLSPIVDR